MYRADLMILHERHTCDSCGLAIEPRHWAYVEQGRMWHRSCRAPIHLFDDDAEASDA
jgi:hypothetical protein